MTDCLSVTLFQSGGLVGLVPHTKELSVVCVCAKLLQSGPTLYDPVDCSPPGSSALGILQARILEWVAMSFIATSLNYHAPLVLRFVCFYLVLIRSLTFQNIGKVETLFQGDFLSNSN